MFGIAAAAAAAGVSESTARKTLRGTIKRGSCTSAAEAALNSGRGQLRAAALATGNGPAAAGAAGRLRLIVRSGAGHVGVAYPTRARVGRFGAPERRWCATSRVVPTPDRVAAAAQGVCPSAVLARAASDPEWEVRACVASNRNSGSGVLSLLVHDDDSDVV